MIKKLFGFYKTNGQLILIFMGIKLKFKCPSVNQLEDACCIPNLKELLESGTSFPHPVGIVINKHAKIGKNCTIFQNVTIGDKVIETKYGVFPPSASENIKQREVPEIGDNVIICAGAIIIGKVKIGDNSLIGAGAVVLSDIPSNSVAVGSPARVIKKL